MSLTDCRTATDFAALTGEKAIARIHDYLSRGRVEDLRAACEYARMAWGVALDALGQREAPRVCERCCGAGREPHGSLCPDCGGWGRP